MYKRDKKDKGDIRDTRKDVSISTSELRTKPIPPSLSQVKTMESAPPQNSNVPQKVRFDENREQAHDRNRDRDEGRNRDENREHARDRDQRRDRDRDDRNRGRGDRDRDKHRESDKDEKRSEELRKYTIEKLIQFISKDNKPLQLYSEDGVYKFIEVLTQEVGEKILIYIPSKYPIACSIQYPSLELKVISQEKENERPSSADLRGYAEIRLGDESIEEQLLDKDEADRLIDYRDIDLDQDSKKNIKTHIHKTHAQLERLSLCTNKIKYKFGVITKRVLSVINRHNDINHFIIVDNLSYRLNNEKEKKDEKEGKGKAINDDLCIVVDLESYYNKLTSFNEDIRKTYVNLFSIFNKVHAKEITELSTKLSVLSSVIPKLTNSYKEHQQFLEMLNNATNKIISFNKQIKALEEESMKIQYSNDTDASKAFKKEQLNKDIEKLQNHKERSIKLYIEIKNKYSVGMLNYDHVLINDLLLIKQLTDSFVSIGVLKK